MYAGLFVSTTLLTGALEAGQDDNLGSQPSEWGKKWYSGAFVNKISIKIYFFVKEMHRFIVELETLARTPVFKSGANEQALSVLTSGA